MKYYFFPCVIILLFNIPLSAQKVTILESNLDYIRIEVDFGNSYEIRDTLINNLRYKYIVSQNPVIRQNGEPYLPDYFFSLGIPMESKPVGVINVIHSDFFENINILPYYAISEGEQTAIHEFSRDAYDKNSFFPEQKISLHNDFIVRYARVLPVSIAPYQYNPVTRELVYNKKVELRIDYHNSIFMGKAVPVKDAFCEEFLRSNVLNYESAINWISKISHNTIASLDSFWYNPQHDFYKIYLSKKGVYRITFQDLLNSGAQVANVPVNNLQMFNEGQPIPIEIVDNGDGIFNNGDYIQFVGYPPKSSPGTYFNIYNLSNVYWLTYENTSEPVRYKNVDGYPVSWTKTIQRTVQTLHYEVDSLYERLGQSKGNNMDHWFWGTSSGIDGTPTKVFAAPFNSFQKWSDSMRIVLRVGMHGMTNGPVYPDHKVKIYLTSQLVDSIHWDGQTAITFEKSIMVGQDLQIYPDNIIQVVADGKIPRDPNQPNSKPVDEIRINWFEFDYWRTHHVVGENFIFKNNSYFYGSNTYSVYAWNGADMKVYIPSKAKLITNPRYLNNAYNEVLFRDTAYTDTEYFLVSSNSFLVPDSIRRNVPSSLRNPDNLADYIIITHSDFLPAAERLADFRSSNLKGFANPRVKVVDVQSIYNEFSAGMLDPYALREFVKYAFENWVSPAPRYVVLVGDMSYDYRKLLKSSRPNFIPSIPFQQSIYGQAVADNNIVTVAGNDLIPDLAIGRISCETLDEANILVDKIINYPADPGKNWREDILLIGGGQTNADENQFGFNYQNVLLEDMFIKNNGFTTTKVFRYPNRPEHMPFLGEGPHIRAAFNKGNTIANYYGHGGGYQWDLVFLNDDIYLLDNENRLPFVTSVTCYTAHFDNQDVFGEQFVKVPGKGAIAFWGSTGLTFWAPAVAINKNLYHQIFNQTRYVVGDAILSAKIMSASSYFLTLEHIALLSLLGDPALELTLPYNPDFNITSSNLSYNPNFPLIEDTLNLNVVINNFGRVFPNDSVRVTMTVAYLDSILLIEHKYLQNFGQTSYEKFSFLPEKQGYYNFSFSVNDDQAVLEEDYNDNTAAINVLIYNLKEPSIIKPNNGFILAANNAEILLSDVGHYIDREVMYHIQIDSGTGFTSPIVNDSLITPADGMVRFPLTLPAGEYFWRVRLLNDNVYSKFTDIRTFSIREVAQNKTALSGNQMKIFDRDNVIYSDSLNAMVLNTSFLPPKPGTPRMLGIMDIELPPDIPGLSAITTDGKFIYYSSMAYYKRPAQIYKIGTGRMGSVRGEDYGPIPNIEVEIWHTMFYYKNFIYVATGDPYSLLKVNPETGDSSRIMIPQGMIDETTRIKKGAFYLCSDGRYVYNLAYYDSVPTNRYTLRIFDPENNWSVVGNNKRLTGTSYANFVGFFVADGYLYAYENYWNGYMRRMNIETGIFEEEWLSYNTYKGFYAWTYDWTNNIIITSVRARDFQPQFYEFIGRYKKSTGSITISDIGPASKWNNLLHNIEQSGDYSDYSFILKGRNTVTNLWDTLAFSPPAEYQLDAIDAEVYPFLSVDISMLDTSFTQLYPISFKNIDFDYLSLPEYTVSHNYINFNPDSLLQGFPITLSSSFLNKGYVDSDTVSVSFWLNDEDSAFFKTSLFLPVNTLKSVEYVIPTAPLLPATIHNVKTVIDSKKKEFYTFNNSAENRFYVARDSVNPVFTLTVDGKEIINGDIVSAKPEIFISMKDNGPLPLRKEDFTIVYNNVQLKFDTTSIEFNYTPYPNSEATLKWNPVLKDGKHTLEILAKDPSGNFFDSTSHKTIFFVYNNFDVLDIYNYPNPFKNDTHFTFELRGDDKKVEECRIRIFTVAGRLVRELNIDPFSLHAGFNRIYWDGRDQDGDELGNGVYFYKLITKNDGITKTTIQKLAKIK
jgi:hypothetical protein